MLSNIKDFLRQRKDRKKILSKKVNTRTPIIAVEKSSQQSDNRTLVSNKNDKRKSINNDLANQLVIESNKRKSQLPVYIGLERFELLRKLGE